MCNPLRDSPSDRRCRDQSVTRNFGCWGLNGHASIPAQILAAKVTLLPETAQSRKLVPDAFGLRPVLMPFELRRIRASAACIPLTEFSEFPEGQRAQGAVWTHCIVIAPPRSQGFLGVFERFEDVRGQALRAQPCIERLDARVVRRLPGAAEVEPHILSIGPRI